jgi:hypothetical protein
MSRRIHAATSGDFQVNDYPHICPRFPSPYNAVTASVRQKYTASLFVLRHTVQLQLGGVAEGKETLKPVQK